MNRSTTQIRLLVAVLVSILSFSFAKAEASDSNLPDSKGWYLGMDGGLPFGLSTFSSFGHDKTHLGWLPASMAAIVSTPFSQQNSLPDMER